MAASWQQRHLAPSDRHTSRCRARRPAQKGSPLADAAAEAGKLISQLPALCSGANLEERRKLLLTMLDAVYVDSKENAIVAIKPKAPFKPVFGVATTREGSEVVPVYDPEAEPRIADQPPRDCQKGISLKWPGQAIRAASPTRQVDRGRPDLAGSGTRIHGIYTIERGRMAQAFIGNHRGRVEAESDLRRAPPVEP